MHKPLMTGVALAIVLTVTAHGQTKTVDERIAELENEVRLLKEQRAAELSAQASRDKAAPIVQVGEKGFGISSANGDFGLNLRGYLQADSVFFLDDDALPLTDRFQISRARLIVEGTLFRDFLFYIAPDFGASQTVISDAYLEWKHWPWLRLRAGKFKPPYSLEQLQSDVDTAFVTRGLPSRLIPSRDVGLQLAGSVGEGIFHYQAGVFNGVADGGSGDIDNSDSKEMVARLFVEPFCNTGVDWLRGLGMGVGGSLGRQEGSSSSPNLASYKTAGQNTFFAYSAGAFAAGERYRITPQASYYRGRLGLMAEYALSSQEVRRDAAEEELRHDGWQLVGSVFLTDDTASFKGTTPRKPFSLASGQWGAWQLVARFGRLTLDQDAFDNGFADLSQSAAEATAWGIGLNWYLNRNIRWYLDYEQTVFDGGAPAGQDRADEHALFTRLQLSF